MLEKEYDIFKQNRELFVKEHKDEYVVIQGDSIIGFFSTEKEAFQRMKDAKLGTFAVQKCVSEEEETCKYVSRVAFA